jgi:hypothetical protein
MRKLIAALAISVLPALGAVTMSAVSAPQAHAFCATAGAPISSQNCGFTDPQARKTAVDSIRDGGFKASGSPEAFPGPQPKNKPPG